jgi:hypothetical protein
MKITTVRFGTDLWRMLEQEAALAGVSVSQYIREAALARASAAAAARGEDPLALLAGSPDKPVPAAPQKNLQVVRERTAAIRAEHKATSAETQLAVHRTRELRQQATDVRAARNRNG